MAEKEKLNDKNPAYKVLMDASKGPLSEEEAFRRAKIYLFNELDDLLQSIFTTLTGSPTKHPETRQTLYEAMGIISVINETFLYDVKVDNG